MQLKFYYNCNKNALKIVKLQRNLNRIIQQKQNMIVMKMRTRLSRDVVNTEIFATVRRAWVAVKHSSDVTAAGRTETLKDYAVNKYVEKPRISWKMCVKYMLTYRP
jgi:hypothetical protein